MEFRHLRENMVDYQIASRGVRDPAVLRAFREVPREAFVTEDLRAVAYEDSPLPIGEDQTISQPYIVALMTEALELTPDSRVLDVGTGSGYGAAILSRIAAEVFTIERIGYLARQARERLQRLGYDNIQVAEGDGSLGWQEHAPFDAIVVAAGGPDIPQHLLEQLAEGGRLVMPVGETLRLQRLLRVRRIGAEIRQENLGDVRFVPLIGVEGWQEDGRKAAQPARTPDRAAAVEAMSRHAEPFPSITGADLQPLQSIVTLTLNPAIDIETDVEQVLPLHKLRCSEPRMDPGGGGINVARVIHELGGTAAAIYTKGGSLGNLLRDLLLREGIAEQPVEIAQQTRESFTANETSSGQQFRFVLPGPDLQESEWRQCLELVASLDPFPDYLVASGSLPQGIPDDFYARLARLVRGKGSCLILDTSGAALGAALQEGVYLIKPNLRELQQLSGRLIGSADEQEEACRHLVAAGRARLVALTLGDEGALLVTSELVRRVPVPKVEIRSPIGAGDSFLGGMTLALAQGRAVEEAFLYGLAAGTAAVITPGTELCRRDDVERLFKQIRAQAG